MRCVCVEASVSAVVTKIRRIEEAHERNEMQSLWKRLKLFLPHSLCEYCMRVCVCFVWLVDLLLAFAPDRGGEVRWPV